MKCHLHYFLDNLVRNEQILIIFVHRILRKFHTRKLRTWGFTDQCCGSARHRILCERRFEVVGPIHPAHDSAVGDFAVLLAYLLLQFLQRVKHAQFPAEDHVKSRTNPEQRSSNGLTKNNTFMTCSLKNVALAQNIFCTVHIVKGEGLLKVTGSHVHRISGNISETVLNRDVTTGH